MDWSMSLRVTTSSYKSSSHATIRLPQAIWVKQRLSSWSHAITTGQGCVNLSTNTSSPATPVLGIKLLVKLPMVPCIHFQFPRLHGLQCQWISSSSYRYRAVTTPSTFVLIDLRRWHISVQLRFK